MPLLLGSSPWLKNYLIGALSEPPQFLSLHASYLQATTPVTPRRTLCCYDGAHSVSVVLSQSVASTIDADEELTGVTTRNLLGYILAPVQVVVLTDMTTSPPSATLLLKDVRVFSDRRHQRPPVISLSVDKDPEVVTALRANIGRQLAAFNALPEKGNEPQSDVELVAVFEKLESERPPLPPRNLLIDSDAFGLTCAQDEPLANGIANGLPHANDDEHAELDIDPKDLELLDPDPLPMLGANTSSTASPQGALRSNNARDARADGAASSHERHGSEPEEGNADGHVGFSELQNGPGKSHSQESKEHSTHDMFTEEERPLTQHFVFDDDNADSAQGASESSEDQDLGDLQLGSAFDIMTMANMDGEVEQLQPNKKGDEKVPNVDIASPSVAESSKRAGDGELQFAPKSVNNQKKSALAKPSTGRRDKSRDPPKFTSKLQSANFTMAITRATRSTTKEVSSDRNQPEEDVEKQPEKEGDSAPTHKDTAPEEAKEKEDEQPKDLDKDKAASEAKTQDTVEPATEAPVKDSKLGEAADEEEHQPSSPRVKTQRPAGSDIQTEGETRWDEDQIKPSQSGKKPEKRRDDDPEKEPEKDVGKETQKELKKEPEKPPPEESKPIDAVEKEDEGDEPMETEQEVDDAKMTVSKETGEKGVEEEQQSTQKMDESEITEKSRQSKKRISPPATTALDEDEIEPSQPAKFKPSTEGKTKRQRNGEDYHLEKIQAELQFLKSFREKVDRNTEMFILNPEHFLPGKTRRSVDRSRRESYPAPRISQVSDLETDRVAR